MVEFKDTDLQLINKMQAAMNSKEEKEAFAGVLLENDEMLKSIVFTAADEKIKTQAMLNPDAVITSEEAISLLSTGPLAGQLITDDEQKYKEHINEFYKDLNGKFT